MVRGRHLTGAWRSWPGLCWPPGDLLCPLTGDQVDALASGSARGRKPPTGAHEELRRVQGPRYLQPPALSETPNVDGERSFGSLGPARRLCTGDNAAARPTKSFLAVGDRLSLPGCQHLTVTNKGFGMATKFTAMFRGPVRTDHTEDRYFQTAPWRTSVCPRRLPTRRVRRGPRGENVSQDSHVASPFESK